jgi:hypothetical protein
VDEEGKDVLPSLFARPRCDALYDSYSPFELKVVQVDDDSTKQG